MDCMHFELYIKFSISTDFNIGILADVFWYTIDNFDLNIDSYEKIIFLEQNDYHQMTCLSRGHTFYEAI